MQQLDFISLLRGNVPQKKLPIHPSLPEERKKERKKTSFTHPSIQTLVNQFNLHPATSSSFAKPFIIIIIIII